MKKTYKYLNPVTGRQVSRQRMWQIRKELAGCCIICGQLAVTGYFCEEHHIKNMIICREGQRSRLGCKRRNLGARSYNFG